MNVPGRRVPTFEQIEQGGARPPGELKLTYAWPLGDAPLLGLADTGIAGGALVIILKGRPPSYRSVGANTSTRATPLSPAPPERITLKTRFGSRSTTIAELGLPMT